MTNKSPEKLGRGPDAPTNVAPQFPRSYKHLHGAPYDPDPGVAAYLSLIGAVLIITIVLLILSIL